MIFDVNLPTFLDLIISAALTAGGFSLALFLSKDKFKKNAWYISLRIILTLLSIGALSNVYSIGILGTNHVQPAELFMNGSVILLLAWFVTFYKYYLVKVCPQVDLENVLKFIHREIGQ